MLDGMGREEMRAADADRQHVADQLRAALDEGRLDLHEYDERLRDAYAAKTYGDLDRLLADLPAATPVLPAAPATPVVRPEGGSTAAWLAVVWGSWAKAAAFFTLIWLLPLFFAGELVFYWPVWVIGPWGAVLVMKTVEGLATGKPRRHAEAEAFRHRLRQHKRERKAFEARAVAAGELPAEATKEQRRQFVDEATARGELPPKPRRPDSGEEGELLPGPRQPDSGEEVEKRAIRDE
jgi:hypothetical protein